MRNTSLIELSQSALANNFAYLRSKLKPGVVLSHVVKGNAYGHGIEQFVPMAVAEGARHFSVFDAHEAYLLYHCQNEPIDILIMGMIGDEQLEWVIEKGLQFYVFEESRLWRSIATAKKLGTKARIHVELETGMNRTGFERKDWSRVMEIIAKHQQHLILEGLCTHFAGAESIANHIRVRKQLKNFRKGAKLFHTAEMEVKSLHTACSAAFIRFPGTHFDMVRVGIMQYGFWPSQETYIATEGVRVNPVEPLQRVISWRSRVMNVKRVRKGEYIGYGTSYLASQEMTIATVPIGYSHGFSRSLSNTGRVLIRGSRVSVIGLVNMNAMTIDVSHLDHVDTGDEVVIIGQQGDQEVSVASFGDFSSQLNYELLTRLPQDIPRVVVN